MSEAPTDVPPFITAPERAAPPARQFAWSLEARPMLGLHGWLKGALMTCAVVDFLTAAMKGSLLWVYASIEGGVVFSDLQLNVYDMITIYAEQLLGWLYTIAVLLSGFLFCRFIYRAIENLDLSHARGNRMPPGWAVAYNFIPILSFWKPLQAMSQAWRGSLDPERNSISPPHVMGWWWALWLIANLISIFSFQVWMGAGGAGPEIIDFEAFKLSLWLDIAASLAAILGALLLVQVISGIAKAQDARMRNA